MNKESFAMNKSLIALGIAAALGIGACSRNEPADGQMSDQQAAAAPQDSASLSAAIDDAGITTQVKQRLSSDARTQSAKVEVETNNGVVTLTGSADSAEAKNAAEELARNVAAVQGINNQITAPSALDDMSARAEGAADTAGANVSDAVITTKVKAKFAADDQVKATAISVDTENGVVKLEGEVASGAARERAVELARNTEGVKSVNDADLKIAQQS